MSRVDEIEYMVACNELTAAQVFTQMRQLIPNKNIEVERDALQDQINLVNQSLDFRDIELEDANKNIKQLKAQVEEIEQLKAKLEEEG